MERIPLDKLDLDLFFEKLDNGLEIYVIPKNDVNNIYVTYTTKYGSNESEFIPLGETEMKKVPFGIAHFLEHKLFEQEDGSDAFAYFTEMGANANAFTNNKQTSYLFSGPDNFEKTLEFLLSYVESPYFTDKNVKKEQGIIEQEIKMYLDQPYSRLYESLLNNVFINHPYKYSIIGTVESVNSITKEDLYLCYNTFYHPSNMFVVVTGNVNPKEVIEQIKTHEAKRNLGSAPVIITKEFSEPNEVEKVHEEFEMSITIPKLGIAYKIDRRKLNHIKEYNLILYLLNIFDLKLGLTSNFYEMLRERELIAGNIDISPIVTSEHIIVALDVETKYCDEVIELINKELKDLMIDENEFNRRKKTILSNIIFMSDSIFKINSRLCSDLTRYGKPVTNYYEQIENLSFDELKEVSNSIDLSNQSIVIVKPELKI